MKIVKIELAKGPSPKLSPVENSIDWLYSWFECSFNMDERYTTPTFIQKILKAAKEVKSYVPVDKQLYRVITSEKELRVGEVYTNILKTRIAYSFTFGKGKTFWDDLADQIGAKDADFCYVIKVDDGVIPLFDNSWVVKELAPKIKKLVEPRLYNNLMDVAKGYSGQKEVVGFLQSKIKTEVVADLTWVAK